MTVSTAVPSRVAIRGITATRRVFLEILGALRASAVLSFNGSSSAPRFLTDSERRVLAIGSGPSGCAVAGTVGRNLMPHHGVDVLGVYEHQLHGHRGRGFRAIPAARLAASSASPRAHI